MPDQLPDEWKTGSVALSRLESMVGSLTIRTALALSAVFVVVVWVALGHDPMAIPLALFLLLPFVWFFNHRIRLYLWLGLPALALTAAKALARQYRGSPRETVFRLSEANLEFGCGNIEAPKGILATIQERALESPQLRSAFLIAEANVLIRVGDLEGTRAMLDAVEHDDSGWFVPYFQGYIAACEGRHSDGQEALTRVDERRLPANVLPVYLATRASLELRLDGDRAMAERWAKRAVQLDKGSLQSTGVLAQARVSLGSGTSEDLAVLLQRVEDPDERLAHPALAFILFDAVRLCRRLGCESKVEELTERLRGIPGSSEYLDRLRGEPA